jgi:hypothetical protein
MVWLSVGGCRRRPDRPDCALMSSVSKGPAPACKRCAATMKFVGKLPSVQHRPEVQVFRCHSCNHVAAEEV